MRMLNFTVDGQRLKKEGDFSGIRAGSVNYLKCQFRSFRVQLVGQNGKTRIVTNAVLIEQV